MTNQNFTTTLSVDQPTEEVFKAINNVRGWWSEEIEGATDKLGTEFTYHHEDVHRCRMKITEFVPGKRVVWKTKLSGRARKSSLKSLKRVIKRKSTSLTRV